MLEHIIYEYNSIISHKKTQIRERERENINGPSHKMFSQYVLVRYRTI